MKPTYSHLLSPLKVGDYIFKNRMTAATSVPHFIQGPERYPSAGTVAHYVNKAKGAAAVTCTGINTFLPGTVYPMDLDMAHFPDFDLYSAPCQNYLTQLADSIHYYQSIASMSVFVGPVSAYPLRKNGSKVEQGKVHGDTGDKSKPFELPKPEQAEFEYIEAHKLPHEYDDETLEKIALSYAEQCEILRRLDFDMVSVHMAYRGNLPAKFMSPHTNYRTDHLGGSLQNRMKFPLRVLEQIRRTVGPKMLIELIWSAEDLPDGYTLDDSVTFLNEAKRYINLVQLRAADADPAHPTGFNLEETPFLHYAAYIKSRVEGLVIGTVGGYQNVALCEAAIAEGKTDLICMARAWISNSDYYKLIVEGRGEDVVPCIRCNKCHGRGPNDPMVCVCSVNPVIGLEHQIDRLILPTDGNKRVAVIGGGPAGMRCALYLEQRGHVVTLYEASNSLGGMLRHADYASFKWPLKQFKDFLICQIEKQPGITVCLNTTVTPEKLERENFAAVIAAVGAEPVVPPVPGLTESGFCFAEHVFAHEAELGRRVVVIGGGEVGVEAGMHLAQHGHEVTVLEMRDQLAADATKIHYRSALHTAWEALPKFVGITNATVTGVKGDTISSVCYRDKDGAEHALPADSIVVSAGMRAKKEEALSFYGQSQEFFIIGDCSHAATVQQAMRQAFAVAHSI